MKRLIDAIIAKWFCAHSWSHEREQFVTETHDLGGKSTYTMHTYLCNKCGRFKKIKSY